MDGPPPRHAFWGKLRREPAPHGAVVAWHPLVDHCCDVAVVCEGLLRRTLLGSRLARAGGSETIDEATVARLCVLAALHDLGKFSHSFQDKAYQPHGWKSAGHVGPGGRAVANIDQAAHCSPRTACDR
jgi:CRISPR-associated endonuclease/helicase Cas3